MGGGMFTLWLGQVIPLTTPPLALRNFSLIGLLTLCFGARVIAAGMGVVRSLGVKTKPRDLQSSTIMIPIP